MIVRSRIAGHPGFVLEYQKVPGGFEYAVHHQDNRSLWYASGTARSISEAKIEAVRGLEYTLKREGKHSRDARGIHRFAAAERSGRAHALHKLAKRGGSHTYASPEVKRTASYKRAERLEEQLAPQRWRTPGLTRSEYERLADAWERAGFLGWADNYRAHVESHKIGRDASARDSGPIRASRTFLSLQSAERYLQKVQKKHPEARIESRHPTPSLKTTVYRVVWKTRNERDRRHHHRTPGAPSFAKQKLISRKIRLLVREGYDPKQAAAIAYRMYGASRKR